jgi:hypothetical protein
MFPIVRPLNIHPSVAIGGCTAPVLSTGATGVDFIASCGAGYDFNVSSYVTAGNNLSYSFAYNTMPSGYSLNTSTGHITGVFNCDWFGIYGDTVIVSNTCGSTGLILDYVVSCGPHPTTFFDENYQVSVGVAFDINLSNYISGTNSCNCSVAWIGSSLPANVYLGDTGHLYGTINDVGTYTIGVKVLNSCSLDDNTFSPSSIDIIVVE